MSPGLTSTGAEPAEVSGAPSVSARCPGVGGPEQRWCIFALSWATSATDLRLGAVRALCQWGSSSESHTDSDVWTLPLSGSDSSDWLVECPGMPPVGLCTTVLVTMMKAEGAQQGSTCDPCAALRPVAAYNDSIGCSE